MKPSNHLTPQLQKRITSRGNMVSDHDIRWFAARLMIEVYDLNRKTQREKRMSVEVKGLAETIRNAKKAIGTASDAAARLQSSAKQLTGTLVQVEEMTQQLDSANAELQAAVGQLSNGGPPLDDTASGAPAVSLQAAANLVGVANTPK